MNKQFSKKDIQVPSKRMGEVFNAANIIRKMQIIVTMSCQLIPVRVATIRCQMTMTDEDRVEKQELNTLFKWVYILMQPVENRTGLPQVSKDVTSASLRITT